MEFDSNKLYEFAVSHGFDASQVPDSDSANWCMKALHPATPSVGPVTGVPDMDSQPSCTLHWRQVDQVIPPAALAPSDTWDLDIILFPGPCLLGAYRRCKTSDNFTPAATETGVIVSNQYDFVTGASHWVFNADGSFEQGTSSSFTRDIKRYRCMYAGFTGILNAASLTDQGMVVLGQMANPYSYSPLTTNVSKPEAIGTVESGYGIGTLWVDGRIPDYNKGPTFNTTLSTTPTAEQWRAKDGFYIPLRFGSGLFEWQDGSITVDEFAYPWVRNDPGGPPTWTYTNIPPCPPMGKTQVGTVSFRGLAPTSSLSITSRFGYEALVEPASVLRAFVTPSCSPDINMVERYFKISSQLGDVYPARYNEDDILSSIIGGIGDLASSFSSMPGPLGWIAKAVSPVAKVVSNAVKPKPRLPPPAPIYTTTHASAAPMQTQAQRPITEPKLANGKTVSVLRPVTKTPTKRNIARRRLVASGRLVARPRRQRAR